MLRLCLVAVLLMLASPSLAQQMESIKDIKFGVGCSGPVAKYAEGLGTCTVDGGKSRIWCPSGAIFDRPGAPPQSFVVRSICGLNQVM
jgi:hypothetical protein